MVLALILQSALTLKLVLCDSDSSIYTSSNQSVRSSSSSDDGQDDEIDPIGIIIFVIAIIGIFICESMKKKSEEQGTGREEVSQLLLNSNLN